MLKHSGVVFSGAVLVLVASGCEPTNQGYAPTQPIAYSHAVHAGVNQINCRYCHFGADKGRYAGIPPAKICMNCHQKVAVDRPEVMKIKKALDSGEPIAWKRVHFLPDHAFFSHKPHIAAKLACQDCHGPVESMGKVSQWAPLTMGWCLDCHRRKGAADPLKGSAQATVITNCSTCHH